RRRGSHRSGRPRPCGRWLNGGVAAAGAREPPGEQGGARCKQSQGEQPRSEREPAASNPDRRRGVEFLVGGEAGVVLVDEALRVEIEVVGTWCSSAAAGSSSSNHRADFEVTAQMLRYFIRRGKQLKSDSDSGRAQGRA